jgi:GNAT superfamily N-acetyltransferase
MYHVSPWTADNTEALLPLYRDFCEKAKADYQWPQAPLPLESLENAREARDLGILILWQNETPVGFWYYAFPPNGALELAVFHVQDTSLITPDWIKQVFGLAFDYWTSLTNWQDFSYGIYGVQTQWAKYLEGLMPSGCSSIGLADQHILQRPILNAESEVFLKERNAVSFPYRIEAWKPKYQDALASVLFHAFKEEPDAFWDARFRSEAGAREVLKLIETNAFGTFYPPLSFIVLNELRRPFPVGGIFLLQSENDTVNIPLFFIHPEHRGKGLAKPLMRQLLQMLTHAVQRGILPVQFINATTNPVQAQALRVYQHFGFECHEAGFHAYSSVIDEASST